MPRYLVMVPEFWFDARTHKVGDSIEAMDTTEILTNVALGRLKPHAGALVEQPKPQPRLTITEFEEIEPAPSRRKYVRRDMVS
jgi:hypothetical protein